MNSKSILVFFGIAWFLFSCSAKREAIKTKNHPERHSSRFLLKELHQNEFQFTQMNMKAAITVKDSGKRSSFHANLRVKKDSAIWISIEPMFGIELARVLITKDTVLFIDRIHRHYFAGNFDFINNKFNIDIDYNTFQSILMGNSIPFDENEKVRSAIDSDAYYLSTIKRRKYRKVVEKDKDKRIRREAQEIQILWLAMHTYKIKKLMLSDFNAHQSMTINYGDYQKVDDQLFPSQLNVNIKADKSLDIKIDYTKLVRNKPKHMVFNIPEKYVRIQ